MTKKTTQNKNKLSAIQAIIIGLIILIAAPRVLAQGLNEDLRQVEQTVKDTVTEVSKQLSGETSTPSAEDRKTIEVIKKRLEKTVEQSKVQGVSDTATRKHGFIGEVVRVSEEAVTVSNQTSTSIIPLKDVRILKANKTIALSDVAVGNWVTALGYVEGSEKTFTPKVLIVSTNTLQPQPKMVILGTIVTIDAKHVEVRPRSGEDMSSFTISSKTLFQDSMGEKAVRADFEEDMTVLLIGNETQADDGTTQRTAKVIRSLVPLTDTDEP